jgi:hypothetical protein
MTTLVIGRTPSFPFILLGFSFLIHLNHFV